MKPYILIADDDADVRKVLVSIAKSIGFEPIEAEDGEKALELLEKSPAQILLADLKMPKMDGLELLERAKSKYPKLPVIMITAHGTVDTAVEAMKKGAYDFITKPFEPKELKEIIMKAWEHKKKEDEETRSIGSLDEEKKIVGESPKLMEVLKLVEDIARTDATVLIIGETGTGKGLIAEAIHKLSARRGSLIKVHCAAIPTHLFESELFGYEKGAFTGAMTSKPGRFELAQDGTIFLDEISTLPIEVQPKLFRVLQDREFERVGGIRTLKTNARVVAASSIDLKQLVEEGKFREELYFRLNVFPIYVPPLRERKEDIPILARHFGEYYSKRLGVEFSGIDQKAMDALVAYDWRGNIRELENAIERALILAKGEKIKVEHLPNEIATRGLSSLSASSQGSLTDSTTSSDLKERAKLAQKQFERALIEDALRQTRGNISKTAKILKLSRRGLQLKLKELSIDPKKFKL